MDLRSLLSFARIKPLAAWSLSAGLLGTSLAYYAGGGALLDPLPMIAAIACVILMQYVAHPMNDLMDLELDRKAPITETGRVKPIAEGAVSVGEAKALSIGIAAVILLLLAYLIFLRPILVLPAAYGLAALIGYNHPSTRWAYGPFTELYLSMPINAISVAVIAFIGSGELNATILLLSVIFGFASSAFFVTMMSMDYATDQANGKMTTIASYPEKRWCMVYPLLGLTIAFLGTPLLALEMGAWPALIIFFLSGSVLIAMSWLGSLADAERIRSLGSPPKGVDTVACRCRIGQLYLTLIFAVAISSLLFYWGG